MKFLPFHFLLNYILFVSCLALSLVIVTMYFIDPNLDPVPFEALQIKDFDFAKNYGAMSFSWSDYGGDRINEVNVGNTWYGELMSWVVVLLFPGTYLFAIFKPDYSKSILFSRKGVKRSSFTLVGLFLVAFFTGIFQGDRRVGHEVREAFESREKDEYISSVIQSNCKNFSDEGIVLRISESDDCSHSGCSDVFSLRDQIRAKNTTRSMRTGNFDDELIFLCVRTQSVAAQLLSDYETEQKTRHSCESTGTRLKYSSEERSTLRPFIGDGVWDEESKGQKCKGELSDITPALKKVSYVIGE